MLNLMLDAAYVDMKARQVVGMNPKEGFLPLFSLKEPVTAGEIVLVTGDPERIRTADLWLDRPVC